MTFDLRPTFSSQAGDGQLYNSEQIAPDEFYNCTWEGLRQTARALGYDGYDDQQLRNVANTIFGRGNYGQGERWETNVAVAQKLWPALGAIMSVDNDPGDVVAAIKQHGANGSRVHCGFWCDSAAWVPPQGPITYSHCLMSLWADDGGVGWVNPEPHPDVYLTDSQIRDLYDGGGILIFAQEDEMTAGQARAWVIAGFGAYLRRPPESLDVLEAYAQKILKDPDNPNLVLAEIANSDEAKALRQAGAGAGAPGPAGPPGPPGPPGKDGVVSPGTKFEGVVR